MIKRRKKNNQKGILKRFFFVLLLLLNILVAVPLLFSFLAQFIPPSASKLIAFSGLAFPFLLLANVCVMLLWIFLKYQYMLISITLILLNTNTLDKHFQFKSVEKPEKCFQCVKVMSYNVRLFDLYNPDKNEFGVGKAKIFDFLDKEKPDIACFQEYFYEKSNKLNFNSTDSILSILEFPNEERYYYQHFPTQRNDDLFYGMAIFSKFRIVNRGYVELENSSNTFAIWVDIRYRGDTIRIYNAHLTSIHFDEIDYEIGRNFSQNLNDPYFSKKTKNIYDKLSVAFDKRELQVKTLKNHIDSCRFPIILCGDFNDTPASYAYNLLAKKMKDTFRESGKGKATTFDGEAFPRFRIDFILHDKRFKAYNHTLHSEITVSDHFPITSYISLLR